MAPVPSIINLALLLGLSLFFGLAFEEFYGRPGDKHPGGVRTFPLLALLGGMLYLLDPVRLLACAAGLVILGGWLLVYYWRHCVERDAEGQPNVGLMVPACNLLAYVLGPIALAEPPWVATGVTVAAVFLLTARERLHGLARQIELQEIVTAGKFLILTGLVLPLLPNEPVTTLTAITPYQAWLALLAVCTLSYASYLLQRFVAPAGSELWIAVLGGLYSSTATTVVLARRAAANPAGAGKAEAGIILATAVMYLRVLAIVAVFSPPIAQGLAPPVAGLSLLGFALAGLAYRRARGQQAAAAAAVAPRNPLELTAAAGFAALFVVISVASLWVKEHFGAIGIYALAAIVGITDIDPFVLNLAQGNGTALATRAAVAAILIATASNNGLKAGYTLAFAGWRASGRSVAALALLTVAAAAAAILA